MITIHLVSAAGVATDITAKPGRSLMEAAIDAGAKGIAADCGGLLTCGTCHVFVREPSASQLPPADSEESGMLDFTAVAREPNSRLSCQIRLTEAMDGITVDLPATQY
ncbi:MAG: 2Fe-2S iron-sulfur cluster binding domain-containing protein [Comamonadaceae bacterium]|nr:MAG: 2Fe-2S iron-sulfur cluster binding domain-containing protein [Comamonadaceae bacterium]